MFGHSFREPNAHCEDSSRTLGFATWACRRGRARPFSGRRGWDWGPKRHTNKTPFGNTPKSLRALLAWQKVLLGSGLARLCSGVRITRGPQVRKLEFGLYHESGNG